MTCHIRFSYPKEDILPTFVAYCTYPLMGFGENIEDYQENLNEEKDEL